MTNIIETSQIQDAARSGDWETGIQMEREQRAARDAAVSRGIASAVEKGFGKPDFSLAERAGIETLTDRVAVTLEEAGVGEEQILRVCEEWAARMAESPIRGKMELADNLERDLTNGDPVPGGLVERALDEVIATMTPYAERAQGWYWTSVMSKL